MNSKAMKLKKICTLHNAVVESSHNSDNNVFTWEPNAKKTLSHRDRGWRWGRWWWHLLVFTFNFHHEFYKWKCLGSAVDDIKDVDSRRIRNKAAPLSNSPDNCKSDGCNTCCGLICTMRLCNVSQPPPPPTISSYLPPWSLWTTNKVSNNFHF